MVFVFLFLIGCEDTREPDCGECGLEIYAFNLQQLSEGHYSLEYDEDLAQTYTMLGATTECGWSRHLRWDTNYRYQINGENIRLVNPGSYTDDNGDANIMFAVWEPFIGYTVKVFCAYQDECGVQYVDSLSISVVNEE